MAKIDVQRGNVLTVLLEQHHQIEELFAETLRAEGSARAEAFLMLRRLIAVHETAEEEVIHPRARWAIPQGEAVAEARIAEETKAKRALVELESLDVDSATFETKLRQLSQDVSDHAHAEERDEFAHLAESLDPDDLRRMERVLRTAEKLAPTRPHPKLGHATENVLMGGFLAMADRARDALARPDSDGA